VLLLVLLNEYTSPAQKLVVPVVATTVLPDSTSSVAEMGMSYFATSRDTVPEDGDPLASTVLPETSSAVSPLGTLLTVTLSFSVA
jgi:hypothetical protein